MPAKTRMLFFGADSFGIPAFNEIVSSNDINVLALVTRCPKPAGRGLKPTPNPMITLAKKNNKPILFAETADDWEKISDLIHNEQIDCAVVAGFGKIIPNYILELLPNRFINIHPSLLPKYRGPSPIETAIYDGQEKTGISFIVLNDKMDAGPIIHQFEVGIDSMDAPSLENSIAKLAASKIISVIDGYISGGSEPKEQSEHYATYTHIITKSDGQIKADDDAATIDRKYRSFTKWPGIFFTAKGKHYKIIEGKKKGSNFCVSLIQPENKNVLKAKDFINGYREVLTELPKFVRII